MNPRWLVATLFACLVLVQAAPAQENPEIAQRLAQAAQLKRAQNWGDAEETYRWVLEREPKNREAHFGLGDVMQSQGRFSEATTEYWEASAGPAAVRINTGGSYTDGHGSTWEGNRGFDAGSVYKNKKPIQGPADATLFQAQHCLNTPFTYSFSLPNGLYRVNLYFSEIYVGRFIFAYVDSTQGPGRRFFGVRINGVSVFDRVDTFAEVGGFTALIKGAEARVFNASLRIQLVPPPGAAPNNWAIVDAIEVIPIQERKAQPVPPPAPVVQTASLRITSKPGSVQVYLNDAPKGVTSTDEGKLVLEGLAPGAYRLRASLPGYTDWRQDVTVSAGQILQVEPQLATAGPKPLEESEIEEALTNGVPKSRIISLVHQFGVDFNLTDEVEQRLRKSGADSDLLLLITKSKK